MAKRPSHLTRDGREWLKARHAQGATATEIGEELLAHDEARVLAPARKRGRPPLSNGLLNERSPLSREPIEDNWALLLWAARCFRLAAERGERVNLQKVLSSVARELRDDFDANIKRLRRRRDGRGVYPQVLGLVNNLITFSQDTDGLRETLGDEFANLEHLVVEIEHTAKRNLEPAVLEQMEKRFRNFEGVWRHAWPPKIKKQSETALFVLEFVEKFLRGTLPVTKSPMPRTKNK
jgi:hypothetical protein